MPSKGNFFDQFSEPQPAPRKWVPDPPRWANGRDTDDDYYWSSLEAHAASGPQSPDDLIQFEIPETSTNGLPLIYFEDIQPNLDAADFIEDILTEGALSVIYGESNCGKTFFMTDLSLHVAMNKTWRGKDIEEGGVIYCALEGRFGISNRVAAFRKHHGLEGYRIPFAIIPSSINMLDPNADTPRLIEAIRGATEVMGVPVKWVIIDTLARAMAGGNENSSEDMGALVLNADKVRQETSAHVSFVHHSGKDAARGARGHSSLRAATDTEIEVTREQQGGPAVATVTKQRDMETKGEFWFSLEPIELGTNRRGKPVTSCVVVEAEKPNGTAGQNGTKGPKLPDGASLAMRALVAALGKAGAKLPPTSDYPSDTTAVSAGTWREEFYQLKSGPNDTKKHAFSRAEETLLARNIITQRNGLVWFVKRDNETGQTGQNGTKRDVSES